MEVGMDWQPMDTKPDRPTPVVLYYGNRDWLGEDGKPVSFGEVRDTAERADMGFWDGETWCESGTGHDCFEPWLDRADMPTAWAAFSPPDKET